MIRLAQGRVLTQLHHACHIQCLGVYGQRIGDHCIFLNVVYIFVHAGGKCHYEGNADNADGTGKSRQQCAAFFGFQVIKAQRQGGAVGHGGSAHIFVLRRRKRTFIGGKRVGVAGDLSVPEIYYPGGVFVGKLVVVSYQHHKPVLCHLF